SSVGPAAVPGNGFDGVVKDTDGDGLPDCWEDGSVWTAAVNPNYTPTDGKPGIDFNGDGIRDLKLCVQVNANGDGTTLVEECASPTQKDVFVEIDYMQGRKPDPAALAQGPNVVGVQSVREAFAAAPVDFLGAGGYKGGGYKGIAIHFQVDEQVTFTTQAGT